MSEPLSRSTRAALAHGVAFAVCLALAFAAVEAWRYLPHLELKGVAYWAVAGLVAGLTMTPNALVERRAGRDRPARAAVATLVALAVGTAAVVAGGAQVLWTIYFLEGSSKAHALEKIGEALGILRGEGVRSADLLVPFALPIAVATGLRAAGVRFRWRAPITLATGLASAALNATLVEGSYWGPASLRAAIIVGVSATWPLAASLGEFLDGRLERRLDGERPEEPG
jgi:hypothetical protein